MQRWQTIGKGMPVKTGKSTDSPENKQDQVGLERLIFFSDAVFAIAITLLSLDLRLPIAGSTLTNSELAQRLLEIWPKYLAYVISFLVIGTFWAGHHRRFRIIQRSDSNLLWLNLLLLMVIAFIPFPTALLSEYGNRTATQFYALVMVLAGVLSAATWWYASYGDRLIDPNLDKRMRRRETWGPLLLVGVFLFSAGLAFINDDIAKLSWLLLAVALRFYR
jgi:uncharacterized membrane protein